MGVVGRGGNIAIDGADATSFTIETEEGVIQVVAPPATVHVPVSTDEREVHDVELVPWLRDRGAPRAAPCKLAEGLLLPGDLVEVEASPMLTHQAAGYRSQRTVIVLKDLPASPLSIRRRS